MGVDPTAPSTRPDDNNSDGEYVPERRPTDNPADYKSDGAMSYEPVEDMTQEESQQELESTLGTPSVNDKAAFCSVLFFLFLKGFWNTLWC
ncbi:hypothetical protein [Peribacillus simplex]|uniref:Uncharacterized protein n=1 Tax=Peribacillus simplex TaxID=1478 RepID=A0AAW7I790_9BACI|nr:hypothetical protein [Peribacillus simplex]MDM5450878.1 hypothetical protein [Peribacillus simplex]